MKLKTLALLIALLAVSATGQQNALVVQQQFSANGSTAWYPVAGYTNHTLTWSQVGSTTVTGCAVQVDSSAIGGTDTGSAGGLVSSQSATSNGTTTVTSVTASYARITVTGCTAGTIKVTYSAVNAALSKGGGGGGGSGTVTSVATGAGLTGGPITGTGTVSVAPLAQVNLIGQFSSVTTTTLYTPTTAGIYTVQVYIANTQMCTTGTAVITPDVQWTDTNGANAYSTTSLGGAVSIQQSVTALTLAPSSTVSFPVWSLAGSPITYNVTISPACATGQAKYDLHILLLSNGTS